MTKFLISENGSVHGFLVTETFDDKDAADKACYELEEKYKDYNHQVNEIKINNKSCEIADYCEEGTTVVVTVTAQINGSEETAIFHVQALNGSYDVQRGCWISNGIDGDMEFSNIECLIFSATSITDDAEDYLEC